MQARAYDIVLFGATGFTGGLTAEYLARHAPADARWAIAGRSQGALDAVKQRLCAIDARCERVGTIVASVGDDAALLRMAEQTRVLLTTVGPFVDYGEPVVRACIAAGCDYLDSTGEPAFVELLRERYAERARERGVRVVTCCGYDSIPADLGPFFTVGQLRQAGGGAQAIRLDGYLSSEAQFSGGTQRSAIKALSTIAPARDHEVPSARPNARVRVRVPKLEKKPALGGWIGPLPTVDASIVARSAAALDRYGSDFTYGHHAVIGSFARVVLGVFFVAVLAVLSRIPPARALLLRTLPKPGQGPSAEQRRKSWFKLRMVAESGGRVVNTEIAGGDPGYDETSKMLAESALCMAFDREALPDARGVLTTAVAMGEPLLARLQRAGLVFRVL
jgi:short subunit dehydrogenase-like uncharacterized protein